MSKKTIIIGLGIIALLAISTIYFWLELNSCRSNIYRNTSNAQSCDKTNDTLLKELKSAQLNEKKHLADYSKCREQTSQEILNALNIHYIKNNEYAIHDNFLWHGAKQIIDKSLLDLIKENGVSGFGEWFRIETNNFVKIYIYGYDDGAMGVLTKYYLEINKNNDKLEIKSDDNLLGKYVYGFPVSEKSVLVYAVFPYNSYESEASKIRPQELWKYDLNTKITTKLLTVPVDYNVVDCGEICALSFDKNVINYENGFVIIKNSSGKELKIKI